MHFKDLVLGQLKIEKLWVSSLALENSKHDADAVCCSQGLMLLSVGPLLSRNPFLSRWLVPLCAPASQPALTRWPHFQVPVL